jgi:hypothetical protein
LPVDWNADDPNDLPVIQSNLSQILRQILKEAPERSLPTIALAQGWHRRIYQGVRLPVDYFAGEIRNSDSRFPELFGYEVIVGGHAGVASWEVPAELASYRSANGVVRAHRSRYPQNVQSPRRSPCPSSPSWNPAPSGSTSTSC